MDRDGMTFFHNNSLREAAVHYGSRFVNLIVKVEIHNQGNGLMHGGQQTPGFAHPGKWDAAEGMNLEEPAGGVGLESCCGSLSPSRHDERMTSEKKNSNNVAQVIIFLRVTVSSARLTQPLQRANTLACFGTVISLQT